MQNFSDSINIEVLVAEDGEEAYGITSTDEMIAYVPDDPRIFPEHTEIDGRHITVLRPGTVLFGKSMREPSWVLLLPPIQAANRVAASPVAHVPLTELMEFMRQRASGNPVQLYTTTKAAKETPTIPLAFNSKDGSYRVRDTEGAAIAFYKPSQQESDMPIQHEDGFTYLRPGTLVMVDTRTKLCLGVFRLMPNGIPMVDGGFDEPIANVIAREMQ